MASATPAAATSGTAPTINMDGKSSSGTNASSSAQSAAPSQSPPSSSSLGSASSGEATSAASRLWSSWVSPSTAAQTAASPAFEARRKHGRPTFEEFRAQEPPQARLIRLRGLFDVLMDKDDEQALAGGRAKMEWTRSATRARYGAGGVYARGSMAPKGSENGEFHDAPSSSKSSSSPTRSASTTCGSRDGEPSSSTLIPQSGDPSLQPPRQSYATELLTQCRECRAQLEKERKELERREQKRSMAKAKSEGGGAKSESNASRGNTSWTSWIPIVGDWQKKKEPEPSMVDSIKDKISDLKDSTSPREEKQESPSLFDSLSSAISSILPGEAESDKSEQMEQQAGLHSDHEGEAGWVGSGVWGLSAVGQKRREANRLLDAQIASRRRKSGERDLAEDEDGSRQRQIEWEGFLRYADQKERELYRIFTELDKNCDMRLDMNEINHALDRAGIELSQAALADFIASLNSSARVKGIEEAQWISFPQFRDYLLLLPRDPSVPEIFRFYQVRKAFGLFGSQGIFAEFSGRWGKSERHGATTVTQDGDVSLAGEERKKPSDDEKEAKREARRVAMEAQEESGTVDPSVSAGKAGTAGAAAVISSRDSSDRPSDAADKGKGQEKDPKSLDDKNRQEEEEEDSDMIHGDVALKFLLAGGIAGAVSRTATAPFDRLKIYLITTGRNTATSEVLSSAGASAAPAHAAAKVATRGFGVLGEGIRALYREGGGLRAFWVGNGLNCLKIFPESAIKFLSYETAKRAFAKYVDGVSDSRDISGTSRFISGGIGGITSQFAIYPVETLKTRLMASQSGRSQGNELLIKTARDMWRNGGMRTYYRGLAAGLIGVFPYSAIDMSTFEGIKLFYIRYSGREEPSVLALLSFGSISGSVGATTVYPLSLVRTRLQAAGTPAHPQTYDGFWDVWRKTYKNEGVVGFYRGLVPSLAKVVPAVSISYVVYERSKRHLGVQ